MADRPRRVLDAHVHLWSPDTTAFPFAPYDGVPIPARPYPVETLLADLDAAAVAGAVVIQPRLYGPDHRYLDQVLQRFPERLTGVYLVDPLDPPSLTELRPRFSSSGGYRGLRLVGLGRSPDWPSTTTAVWDLAGELGAVLSLLVEPRQLSAVGVLAERYPEVPVVIDHLGHCDPTTSSGENLLAPAAVDNVVVKVSALGALSRAAAPYPDLTDLVAACRDAFGARRLLWGSDLPHALAYGSYRLALDALLQHLSGLDEVGLAMLLGGNTARLYSGPSAP